MRTEKDKINRREANRRYYQLDENKEQKRNYMKAYAKRDNVKARAHEYYVRNKNRNWGGERHESQVIKDFHEEWAKKNGYRGTGNEQLNVENSERFIKNGQK